MRFAFTPDFETVVLARPPVRVELQADLLSVELAARAGADTREIDDGIVLDVDAEGHLVGIDIDQASRHLDLRPLDVRRIPIAAETAAG